jgi:two-component system, chemotaxis family, chemotaxis protein CheY
MSATGRIMVIDDDEAIREFVSWVLSDDGYEVVTANHGAVALGMLERWHPDVILLDMRMPVMDGWEFSRAYREMDNSHAPIVVLTAARDAADSADEIGADGYLSKPFDLLDLLDVVRRFRRDG